MPDSCVETLINTKEPFLFSEERDRLFLDAMRESFTRHYENCPIYKRLCNLEGFIPDLLREYDDIFYIPHLFTHVLKRRTLFTGREKDIELTLTSSGTTGEKSEIHLDGITLSRIRRIVWNIYESYGMADENVSANCLLFSYEYEHAKNVGTAFSDDLLSCLTGRKSTAYALLYNEEKNDFELDFSGIIKSLMKFSKSGAPLRIIGFPAFLYEVCEEYKKRNLSALSFGKDSFIITGGGWKTKADKEIPRKEFKNLMSQWLGLPSENVRDLFGMVEHGVPYCECEAGNLHVPVYSRVVVRDPATMRILPDGEIGIFHLYTPYLHSFPAISLLTTDLGYTGRNCPCGRNAPYIEITGRGGMTKHKGCAVSALDYIK